MALTGFSQGGMMSLHCGLHMQVKPGAIVSFSGALLVHNTLPKLGEPTTSDSQPPSSNITYPPVQLVHGTEDMVVPFALMQEGAVHSRKRVLRLRQLPAPALLIALILMASRLR